MFGNSCKKYREEPLLPLLLLLLRQLVFCFSAGLEERKQTGLEATDISFSTFGGVIILRNGPVGYYLPPEVHRGC